MPLQLFGPSNGSPDHNKGVSVIVKHYRFRRLASSAVAVAIAAGTVLAASSSAHAAWQRIEDKNTGLVAAPHTPAMSGSEIELQSFGLGNLAVTWQANPKGSYGLETFEFENQQSHYCLDVVSPASGAAVVQAPCNNTLNQRWIRWHDPYDTVWRIFNYWSGYYLAVQNAGGLGTDFVQLPYSRTSNSQQFYMY